MVFPILGGNSAVAGGYSIDNSIRFNDGDSPDLSRTNVASPTNSKKYTYSVWIKRGIFSDGNNRQILSAINGNNRTQILYRSGSNEAIMVLSTDDAFSTFKYLITTNALYRDASAWYHVVCVFDSTNATANDRFKIYVNGVEQSLSISTSVASNYDDPINSGSVAQDLGSANGSEFFDGYFAEAHFIDGQALSPTDFGEFDEDSGIWKPIQYTGTYGTNGFYLDFENSGSLGADQSGNGNNFTPTNLASTDQMIDTPTRNFCTMNPLDRLNIGGANSEQVTSEGNLKSTGTGSEGRSIGSTFAITPNGISKAYAEWYSVSGSTSKDLFYSNNINGYIANDDATAGNIVMMAVDCVAGKYWFGNNGTWDASGDPANGTNPTGTFTANSEVQFGHRCYDSSRSQVVNFGQDSTFAGNTTRQNNTDSNGEGDFYYAPPTGFLSLNSSNLSTQASPTIDDGSAYFQTKTYTGNGVETAITNDGNSNLQPDLIWFKARSAVYYHGLFDSTRGTELRLSSNVADAEVTKSSAFTSFDSNGFTVGADVSNTTNASGQTFVAWQWKANGGTTSSNTDGDITSTVQVNSTAGFSIVTYSGNGSASLQVGHGLGTTPDLVIQKSRSGFGSQSWNVWGNNLGFTRLALDNSNADAGNYGISFSSTTITLPNINDNAWSNTGGEYLLYVFKSIEGYSKMGSFIGNNSLDGAYIYLGFRPAFVMIKSATITGTDWQIADSKRNTYNVTNAFLEPNTSDAENTARNKIDLLSNGFKCRESYGDINGGSGDTFIYYAVAENPFCTSTGIPVCGR